MSIRAYMAADIQMIALLTTSGAAPKNVIALPAPRTHKVRIVKYVNEILPAAFLVFWFSFLG